MKGPMKNIVLLWGDWIFSGVGIAILNSRTTQLNLCGKWEPRSLQSGTEKELREEPLKLILEWNQRRQCELTGLYRETKRAGREAEKSAQRCLCVSACTCASVCVCVCLHVFQLCLPRETGSNAIPLNLPGSHTGHWAICTGQCVGRTQRR